MMNQEFAGLLREALVCSIFVAPLDPGLSNAEIFELGRQAGFQDGEIRDTFSHVSARPGGRNRSIPSHHDVMFTEIYEISDPPLLDRAAADFVIGELNARIRADGIAQARLDRGAAVERAVAAGHERNAIEGAITCLVLGELMTQTGDALTPRHANGTMDLIADRGAPRLQQLNARRARALALARDVIGRRTDGRPRHAEPLDAFGEALEQIGFRQLRSWWRQAVTELRASDPGTAPISCAVLSMALVEGALTFVARHARDRQLGAFQPSNFEGEPQTWRAERLIESAAAGANPILSGPLRARAEHLNRVRQRVHAGRMLSEHPMGVQDLRPEEGRDARATAEQVVRAVIDWLGQVSPA